MIAFIWSILTDVIGLRWLLFVSVLSLLIHQCVWKNWSYFSQNRVKFIRGIPLLGSQWRVLLGRETFVEANQDLYNRFPDEKVIGSFELAGAPSYIVRDPELIKQIAIKDFDHFLNHRFYVDHDTDPLFGRTLIVMHDQRWKSMRSALSPAFTGSKMRLMFSLIGDVCQLFCSHLKHELTDGKSIECDIREFFGRFANDAIASCAFGLNINSMANKNNDFYKIGQSVSNFGGFRNLMKFIVITVAPKLAKYLKISLISQSDSDYFRQIVVGNIDHREKNGIVRNDMINMLMELKKGTIANEADENVKDENIGFATVQESSMGSNTGHITNWTDDDLIAQCLIFLLGGFDTVSVTLCFLAYDLAIHADIQAGLYREIQETNETLNGKPLTYEILQKIKYLDMVLSESMRMWPQIVISDRVVNKPYNLDVGDGKIISLKEEDIVIFPIQGLHYDPKYFPEPNEFRPERFSDANKGSIVAGTYMPFGIGPRNCIASRFALMECKACIFHLLLSYKLEMCPKTQYPLKLKKGSGAVEPENGFWMRIKSREK